MRDIALQSFPQFGDAIGDTVQRIHGDHALDAADPETEPVMHLQRAGRFFPVSRTVIARGCRRYNQHGAHLGYRPPLVHAQDCAEGSNPDRTPFKEKRIALVSG